MDIRNIAQTMAQFNNFRQQFLKSGRKPEDILNELITSGRVTQAQFEQAKQLAQMVNTIKGGFNYG